MPRFPAQREGLVCVRAVRVDVVPWFVAPVSVAVVPLLSIIVKVVETDRAVDLVEVGLPELFPRRVDAGELVKCALATTRTLAPGKSFSIERGVSLVTTLLSLPSCGR
jgi:hypothetical protein